MPTDSRLDFLRAGDVTGDRDEEIVGIDSRSAWVVTPSSRILQRLEYRFAAERSPQTTPTQALVCDLSS